MEAAIGEPITLQCKVDGTPEIRISWYKEHTKLRSAPAYKMQFKNNVASFVINKVDHSDVGEYTCKAENSVGAVASSAVLVIKGDDSFHKSCCMLANFISLKYQHFTMWWVCFFLINKDCS